METVPFRAAARLNALSTAPNAETTLVGEVAAESGTGEAAPKIKANKT